MNRVAMTAADELFAALDGQIVADGNERWEVRIWGIHPDRGRLWLQISFVGLRSFTGTIAVGPGRASDMVREFMAWLRSVHHTEFFCPLTLA